MSYLPFFELRLSETVVRGFLAAVELLTYRPVIALRWLLPLLADFAIPLTPSHLPFQPKPT